MSLPLDEREWQTLEDVLRAHHRRDKDEVQAATNASDALGGSPRWWTVTYLMALMQLQVVRVVGHKPTSAELDALADTLLASSVGWLDQPERVRELLLEVFWYGPAADVNAAKWSIYAAAILGMLLRDPPDEDLVYLKRRLAQYLDRHQERLLRDYASYRVRFGK